MEDSSEFQSPKPTKRQWTAEEDSALMISLLRLAESNHWKADAGTFKPGYCKELEKYIREIIPNCTLKASPHIESRVKHLKVQYFAIKDMLGPNASGFGWDDTRKMIVVEKEIYKEWCKSHRSAVGLYGKPFPHYDTLDFIYGKDKANGGNAENPAEAAFSMEREVNQTVPEVEPELNLGGDENFFESQTTQVTGSTNQSRGGGYMSKAGKRGGKRPRYNDAVSESIVASLNKLGTFHERASDNIEKLATCFVQDKNSIDRSNLVTSTLKEIEGLSVMDMVKAAILINNNNKLCESFLTMDTPEMKKGFVYLVLTNNGAIGVRCCSIWGSKGEFDTCYWCPYAAAVTWLDNNFQVRCCSIWGSKGEFGTCYWCPYAAAVTWLDNNFQPTQVTLLKQEKVACLDDNDARLALDPHNKYKIQTKPHGHGDVHSLLYSSGIL
ncbi:hypothetical protein RIF29_06181 [Crotalaria pallida]|uniref:Myb/SANT-like domain-containing protein n=1 Tax=Crotalaria pallida TaxID=3830 RepID=A0AAN9J5J0_CROPI